MTSSECLLYKHLVQMLNIGMKRFYGYIYTKIISFGDSSLFTNVLLDNKVDIILKQVYKLSEVSN